MDISTSLHSLQISPEQNNTQKATLKERSTFYIQVSNLRFVHFCEQNTFYQRHNILFYHKNNEESQTVEKY